MIVVTFGCAFVAFLFGMAIGDVRVMLGAALAALAAVEEMREVVLLDCPRPASARPRDRLT